MSLAVLHTFLNADPIPHTKRHLGFLEIIGKQHHENINSSIYAHFINASNEHVRNLFLESLTDLVELKSGKSFQLLDPMARTEVSTGSGRIDILVEDRRGEKALIIENKIYHWLHNDLMDYWQHVKISEDNKVGILLTLEPQEIVGEELKDKFINITHLEWINAVSERWVPGELPENYRVYISDFMHTIRNLSTLYQMNESSRFYFRHAEAIQRANATMYEAHTFLNNQLQRTADKLGWSLYGNAIEWRNIWDAENEIDTFLTVVTKELLEGKMSVMIILELYREDIHKENELRLKFADHPQIKDKTRGSGNNWYQHMLCKSYTLTEAELENLSDFLLKMIRLDFGKITVDIIEYLYAKKDISKWKDNFLSAPE